MEKLNNLLLSGILCNFIGIMLRNFTLIPEPLCEFISGMGASLIILGFIQQTGLLFKIKEYKIKLLKK